MLLAAFRKKIMDNMNNAELKNFFHTYYTELYNTLLELGALHNIPYFTFISALDEHLAAAQLGFLHFEYESPFMLKDEEFVLSFLSGSPESINLFNQQQSFIDSEPYNNAYPIN